MALSQRERRCIAPHSLSVRLGLADTRSGLSHFGLFGDGIDGERFLPLLLSVSSTLFFVLVPLSAMLVPLHSVLLSLLLSLLSALFSMSVPHHSNFVSVFVPVSMALVSVTMAPMGTRLGMTERKA